MPPLVTTRGAHVARRRTERGWTQEGLARRLGCSTRTVQRVENDDCTGMSQRIIEALHRHLGVPLGELVSGKRSRRERQ